MKNRVNEFKVCPMCGQSDKLKLLDHDLYWAIMSRHSVTKPLSLVAIECNRCNLTCNEYTMDNPSTNYDILVGDLKKRWNRMPRKDNVNG